MKETCASCDSDNLLHIEYGYPSPEQYDGISEIECLSCGDRYGRWTGTKLADDEIESRYGENGHVKRNKEEDENV